MSAATLAKHTGCEPLPQTVDLWEMYQSQAEDVLWAIRLPDRYANAVLTGHINPSMLLHDCPQRETIEAEFERLQSIYERLGGKSAASEVATIRSYLNETTTLNGVVQATVVFGRLFAKDAIARHCILLSDEQASKLEARAPFGQLFADKFPEAAEDAIAASKCFALEQWSGCVFHLIRVSERPLKALLKTIGIGGMDNSQWGDIIEKIEAELRSDQAKPTPSRTFTLNQIDLVRSIVGYLQPLKRIRNNRVMHVDDDLPDELEARKLYGHVTTFVHHVAEHLNNQGILAV